MFRLDRHAHHPLLAAAVITATSLAPLHGLPAQDRVATAAEPRAEASLAKIRREIATATVTSRRALEGARHGAAARAELADAARRFDAAEKAADALGRTAPTMATVAKELHDEAQAGRATALLGSADLELARSNLAAALADVDLVLVDDPSNATAMRLRADIENAAAAAARDNQMLLVVASRPMPVVVPHGPVLHDPRWPRHA